MNSLTKIAAVILLGLVAAFVVYVFTGSSIPTPTPTPSSPWALNGTGFKSHKECQECHPKVFEEWQRSFHAQAWTDPWVSQTWACYADQDCKNCHAPLPVFYDGKRPRLEPRTDDLESGVNCLTCHWSPLGILAPTGINITMKEQCNPIKHELIATDAMCWECHPNQYDDWKLSAAYRRNEGCKSCHMDAVEREIVPNGEIRKARVHFWKGAHTYTFLKTSYEFKYELGPESVDVKVTNAKSGHFLPAERHNRALWVDVTFYDESGKQVGDTDKWIIREGSNLPRNVKELDIKPDTTVSRKFKYPLARGTVKLTLKFDYFYSNEDEYTRVLEDPAPVKFEKK